jgi:lysozyme
LHKIKIGVGRNLSHRGLDPSEIDFLFEHDLKIAIAAIKSFVSNFSDLHSSFQTALVSLAFNLGSNGLSEYRKLQQALLCLDYQEAAIQVLDSKWARRAGDRANEISDLIKEDLLFNNSTF